MKATSSTFSPESLTLAAGFMTVVTAIYFFATGLLA